MVTQYEKLKNILREIFQIDKPELDFGIYRILNSRAKEINDYLENRLKAKVQTSLAEQAQGDSHAKIKEITENIREEFGKRAFDDKGNLIDDEAKASPLGKQLQTLLSSTPTQSEHENAVFTHLCIFFARYYDKGDFISQRRYKGDTYAIPYAGEEVMLHWANKDQYYTKSGENFSNYGFKLEDGRYVRFRLIAADTAKDNRKDNDKDRRFVLIEKHTRTLVDEEGEEYEEELLPIEEINNELVIRFEYKVMPKNSKQDALVKESVKTILANDIVKTKWAELSSPEPTEKNPDRTLLEKCLMNYTTKNTADYFIHKDLETFLRRELDFYIKNEVMHLDDVQTAEKFTDIEKNLRMIQTLRSIALDLITFLSQLENFQKKLWLKKKFVVSTDYCITLDRIPETLYPAIAANKKQWDQWESLGMLQGKKDNLFNQAQKGSVEYLKEHPFLMADTALFDTKFKTSLLSTIDDIDETTDGFLIHSDNLQALNLLQTKYREKIKCIYTDPPYNTAASEILYKNSYKHSSWCALMHDRLISSKNLLSDTGIAQIAIDDEEFHRLEAIVKEIFGDENYIGNVAIMHNPKGRDQTYVADSHEYTIMTSKNINMVKANRLKLTEQELLEKYPHGSDGNKYRELPLRRSGSAAQREDRPYMYFPFLYNKADKKLASLPDEEYKKIYVNGHFDDAYVDTLLKKYESQGFLFILPIRQNGTKGRWRWGFASCKKGIVEGGLFAKENGDSATIYAIDTATDTFLPKTLWYGERYDASTKGTNLLKEIIPNNPFDYPKSIFAVEDMLAIGSNDNDFILDFFAGSGTTAHAVVKLNRQDMGRRKYILIEQGEHFETVLKPRTQKIIYSADWKNGKPTSPETGISHAFKVIKLESYEDALNNLELRRSKEQEDLLTSLSQDTKEDYLLNYLLDVESRGSILSVEQFNKPFDCQLKVTIDSAGAYETRTIDLVETFNYLIGLRVKHIDMQYDKGFVLVTGFLPSGEKALVIWRDTETVDYEKLDRLCEKLAINPADSEYEVVYINGDHNIPSVFTSTEAEGNVTKSLKIRQIEPDFLQCMFSEDNQ
jgi:adenine-specific DNA-methyltransferase